MSDAAPVRPASAVAPEGGVSRGRRASLRGPAALAAALVSSGAAILWIRANGGPEVFRAGLGPLATALWIPLQVVVNLSPASDFVPCAVVNGSLYGVRAGALLSWVVWLVAASLEYAIGRRTGEDLGLAERRPRLPAWLRDLPIEHPAVLIVGHWVPVSSSLINLAAGAWGVPYRRLLWCTAIAMAPPALASAAIGAGLVAGAAAL